MSEEVKTNEEQVLSRKLLVLICVVVIYFVTDILSFFWGFKLSPETLDNIKYLALMYMGTHAATDVTALIFPPKRQDTNK